LPNWDSPLLYATPFLAMGYIDFDGDGTEEIVMRSPTGRLSDPRMALEIKAINTLQ